MKAYRVYYRQYKGQDWVYAGVLYSVSAAHAKSADLMTGFGAISTRIEIAD